MRLVTRYSFVDRNHINYEVTIEDPKVFSRPWKMRMPVYRRVEPNVTVENERAKLQRRETSGISSRFGYQRWNSR